MDTTWEDDVSSKKPANTFANKNQWEGEDEEDDVQDSWDQEPEDEPQEELEKPAAPKSIKNDKKRKKGPDVSENESQQELSHEEKMAEKSRRQKLQEESDLNLAKEMFGVNSLETREDFDQFREEITRKISECSKNADFAVFAEQIIQSLCLHLSSSDIKKVHNQIGNLHIEKLKLEKGEKAKKHKYKIKAKLKMDDETDYNEYSAYTEDFGDFM